MAEKEIKITFAGEKLEALSFFLAEQGGKTVEELLKSHLDKSYEKNVPAQVRKHPAGGAGRHRIRKGSRESRCRKPWKRQQKIR